MGQALGALDTNFWNLERENTRQCIASFCDLDATPDIEIIRKQFLHSVSYYPKLAKRVSSRLTWENDPSFSLDNHITYIKRAEIDSREKLTAFAGELFEAPLDKQKPLWHFYIISNESKDNLCTGLLFKAHHSFADGLSGLELLKSVCKPSREESLQNTPYVARTQKQQKAKKIGFISHKFMSFWQSLKRLFIEITTPRGKSAYNAPTSTKRDFSTTNVPVATLRKIQKQTGGTLNELILCCLAGAIRQYHEKLNAPVSEQIVLMPVNLRSHNEWNIIDNRITAIGVPLPVDISDTHKRLKRISATIQSFKRSGAFGTFLLAGKLNALFPARLQRYLCEMQAVHTNFICTNLPGPRKPMYIGGAKIKSNHALAALMKEQGIAFAFISYAKTVYVTALFDPTVCQEAHHILDYFNKEVMAFTKQN
jgi:WS/DGAT/MGAT family acyltransferase